MNVQLICWYFRVVLTAENSDEECAASPWVKHQWVSVEREELSAESF